LNLFFCNLDSVSELYSENDLLQLVLSIETTPMFLGLSKLEDHMVKAVLFDRHPFERGSNENNSLPAGYFGFGLNRLLGGKLWSRCAASVLRTLCSSFLTPTR
jgi:hypothetical protein